MISYYMGYNQIGCCHQYHAGSRVVLVMFKCREIDSHEDSVTDDAMGK